MSKIGVMMSAQSVDAPMSGHFGKAEWLMVVEEAAPPRFVANAAANGHGVVAQVLAEGCSEVIFSEIGGGAARQLFAAGIRGWVAPKGLNGSEALARLRAGALMRLDAASLPLHEGGGCCCGHGKESAAATGCCSR